MQKVIGPFLRARTGSSPFPFLFLWISWVDFTTLHDKLTTCMTNIFILISYSFSIFGSFERCTMIFWCGTTRL